MTDWKHIGQQAAETLSQYLRIQSLNPPGDVRDAAVFLTAQLAHRGLPVRTFAAREDRPNLVARLRGNGAKEPILLYNHMDVVPADPTRWTDDPFSGAIRDGCVWGRGAIDMKGMGIMQLLALELLQQDMPERTRDIVFYAAPDEETGSEDGTQWMIEHHWEEVQAEFVWDEGGFGLLGFFGPQPVFSVAVAEKKDLWIKLIAHGEPGHSGMPHDNNAIDILTHALAKVKTINEQYELHPITRQLFNAVGGTMPFPQSFLLRHLNNPFIFKLVRPMLAGTGTIAAMLKDTLSITRLHAGEKENVIPERAEATLDIRLLPDHSHEVLLTRLQDLIADDRIEIEIIHAPADTSVSDVQSEFFTTLADTLSELVPEGTTAPMMTPGTTDSCFFRRKGVHCYGLFPAVITPDEFAGFHGIDEHISIENLILGTRVFYEVLKKLCE